MRPLELTLSLLTILSAILLLIPRISDRIKSQALPLLLILTTLAHIAFEGFRWQLWPLFIAVLFLILLAVRKILNPERKKRLIGIIITALVLAAISLAAGILLPVPKPFTITGPYQVGTTIFPLTDTSRTELYADHDDLPREIIVQVWYPATPTGTEQQALYMPDADQLGPAIADWVGLPSFGLNHLKYAKANAWLEAPIASSGDKFPLLIFSHGWSGFKEQNIYQMEELASHGYVVAAINHTYGAVITVFPDGGAFFRNNTALPSGVSEEEYARASNQLVRQWAGDIGFVLDEFALLDQGGNNLPFAGSLDLDKVGVLGHSTGGGAITEFCGIDSRCKAALAMDLWIEPVSGEIVTNGLTQRYLFLHSETWATDYYHTENYALIGEMAAATSEEGTEIIIVGSAHYDFSNMPQISPLSSAFGFKGPIPGDSGLTLINFYSLAFFDHALRGADGTLLNPENAPNEYAQFVVRP